MIVRELIELLRKQDQDRLVEIEVNADFYSTDPIKVQRQGDVVVISTMDDD